MCVVSQFWIVHMFSQFELCTCSLSLWTCSLSLWTCSLSLCTCSLSLCTCSLSLCTCSLSLSCAHVLSVWVVHIFSQFVHMFSQFVNMFSQFVNMFSQFELCTCSLSLCTCSLSLSYACSFSLSCACVLLVSWTAAEIAIGYCGMGLLAHNSFPKIFAVPGFWVFQFERQYACTQTERTCAQTERTCTQTERTCSQTERTCAQFKTTHICFCLHTLFGFLSTLAPHSNDGWETENWSGLSSSHSLFEVSLLWLTLTVHNFIQLGNISSQSALLLLKLWPKTLLNTQKIRNFQLE